ncbi:MAG: phosphoribosylamine--glycine ligase [Burkholderiales bacterium]|jgi:phosphoribosylamine--glycine ligase|nr:phosphoribosylamine--glycine ligase [Burkholderiales bacterium]
MTTNNKILVIGNGGREHALAWKIAKSPKVDHVYVAPGNGGTAQTDKISNISLTDIAELIKFAKDHHISFTVVGPEAPLAAGIVDEFRKHGLKIWGPTKFCAQLESSKAFAKEFMLKHNIPTANYVVFDSGHEALEYLKSQSLPIVIKADGLAAGKGVLVATNISEAINFINDIFSNNKFGSAGSKVVIEEFLDGTEASFIVMIDNNGNILPMASSQDHKRLLNQDMGPNTGGMGAYSPAPIVSDAIHQQVIKEIIQPVIDGMRNVGHSYSGFLYAGLMIGKNNKAKTLEFNCRFGDPETQPIMSRLESDLCQLIEAGIDGDLDQVQVKWSGQFAIGVVLASEGYPDAPRKNDIISGLDKIKNITDVKVFHAGTKLEGNTLYTDGGRILCVVGLDKDFRQAQKKAYDAIKQITFNGMQYRTDIGSRLIL